MLYWGEVSTALGVLALVAPFREPLTASTETLYSSLFTLFDYADSHIEGLSLEQLFFRAVGRGSIFSTIPSLCAMIPSKYFNST